MIRLIGSSPNTNRSLGKVVRECLVRSTPGRLQPVVLNVNAHPVLVVIASSFILIEVDIDRV